MKTFLEWLEANGLSATLFRPRRLKALEGYQHYQCQNPQCGKTLDDSWIKEFGPRCSCGGKLVPVAPDAIDQETPFFQKIRLEPRMRFGSSK